LGLYIYAGEDVPEEDKAAVDAGKLQQEDMTPPDADKQLFADSMIRFARSQSVKTCPV
jgi:hypothetical protein